jgi:hypothetical protein
MVDVIVSIDDAHMGRVQEVADRLRAAGMDVRGVHETIGTVTGSVDDARLADLSRVEGVQDVERARGYSVAPPESDVQ